MTRLDPWLLHPFRRHRWAHLASGDRICLRDECRGFCFKPTRSRAEDMADRLSVYERENMTMDYEKLSVELGFTQRHLEDEWASEQKPSSPGPCSSAP